MTEALLDCGAKVVASYVLAGGILSGKYADGAGGRMAGEIDDPRWEGAVRAARELAALAAEVRRRRPRWRWPSS
jgi:aryl-alcohol dehydrogenase-like predicted oxidoreductase